MAQPASPITPVLDYSTTIIGALELSERKWVLAVQFPGNNRHSRHSLEASCSDLFGLIERLNRSSDGGMAKYPTFQGDMPYGAP